MTSECIDSIREKTQGLEYEIILVDNASTDGSKEFFEKDERITYFYSERNGGFGYGNNLGMKKAKGKYFFLLNSDTLLVNNAVKEFFDYSESHKEKNVYGCYLQHSDGSYAHSFFYFPAFTIRGFLGRVMGRTQKVEVDYTEKVVQAISGADMFFHRELYDRTGGFDEKIFLYGEEGEWQYRMLNMGYECLLIPQPKIIHLEGQSMNESPTKLGVKWQSHFYILKKYMRPVTYYLARSYYAFNLTIRNMGHLFDTEHRAFWKTIYS